MTTDAARVASVALLFQTDAALAAQAAAPQVPDGRRAQGRRGTAEPASGPSARGTPGEGGGARQCHPRRGRFCTVMSPPDHRQNKAPATCGDLSSDFLPPMTRRNARVQMLATLEMIALMFQCASSLPSPVVYPVVLAINVVLPP